VDRRVALVVEHDRATGELISLLLRQRGYETSVANTYEQALSLWDATNPRLVVIDPVLRDGDGLALARIAKPHARVILTSANPRPSLPGQRIADAADELGIPLVAKPFATDDLLAQIESDERP
jgi:DNA-binding response OmpR family regulator